MIISVQKHISTISERLHTHTFNTHISSWDLCNCMTDNDAFDTRPICGSYRRHLKTSNVNFYISIPSQIIYMVQDRDMWGTICKHSDDCWVTQSKCNSLTSWRLLGKECDPCSSYSYTLYIMVTLSDDITTITRVNIRIITRCFKSIHPRCVLIY
jgi:hypothetical protein